MTCPKNLKGEYYPQLPHGAHDYEYIPYCATRVCNHCQDHAGKDSCNNCTWRRPSGEETTPFYEHGKSDAPKDEHLDQNDLGFSVDGKKPICMADDDPFKRDLEGQPFNGDTPVQRDLEPNQFTYGTAILHTITEPFEFDVQLGRGVGNVALTNVPWTVIHHSPTGFEWGYGGSGPADLALNILNAFVPPLSGVNRDKLPPNIKGFRGYCSKTAWDLHQAFKWRFIGGMSKHGGTISKAKILEYLERAREGVEA